MVGAKTHDNTRGSRPHLGEDLGASGVLCADLFKHLFPPSGPFRHLEQGKGEGTLRFSGKLGHQPNFVGQVPGLFPPRGGTAAQSARGNNLEHTLPGIAKSSG